MNADWALGFGLVLTSLVAAFLGVLLVHYLPGFGTRGSAVTPYLEKTDDAVFLFDGEVLVDSSPSARAILSANPTRSPAWVRLMSYLAGRFPDVSATLLRLPHEGVITLASDPAAGDPILLLAELRGGLTRISLVDPENEGSATRNDPLSFRALSEELTMLRDMVGKAPFLVWRTNKAQEVFWANPAYLTAAASMSSDGQEISWPLPHVFDPLASSRPEAGQRQKLVATDGKTRWFDIASHKEGEGWISFASSADAIVQAETSLRDFMQTLTKTFAQLHVGLAIFDKSRALQLFNPALLDLTGLPIDFLSARPTLLALLDAMRDRNMIPEPKDYRSWRRQLVEMEKAAASGLYEDTWSLPGGQTYRVVGRPHPNGALALMLEDISNEMLRTRRYRADLELGQSVLDGLPDALAVFSEDGQLVLSNAAYVDLWGHDPSVALGEATVGSICRYWRAHTAPSQLWSEVETFVTNPGDRLSWQGQARMSDGRLIDFGLSPLAGGPTLVTFRLAQVSRIAAAEEPASLAEAVSLRA